MENLGSSTKRKRRKTRKCLDELRKRSHRHTNENETPGLERRVSRHNNVSITSHRLTLTRFPKAIRSETITRPAASGQQGAPTSKAVEPGLPLDTVLCSTLSIPLALRNEGAKQSDVECIQSTPERCDYDDSDNLTDHDDSPDCFSALSASAPSAGSVVLVASEGSQSPYTSSPPSSRRAFGYRLYEEFMNDIPMYLQENTPLLAKDDVVTKTKSILHNIYMEGRRRRECEDNNTPKSIKKCVIPSVTAQRPLVQHPSASVLSGCSLGPAAPALAPASPAPAHAYYPHRLHHSPHTHK